MVAFTDGIDVMVGLLNSEFEIEFWGTLLGENNGDSDYHQVIMKSNGS